MTILSDKNLLKPRGRAVASRRTADELKAKTSFFWSLAGSAAVSTARPV